ncbi:DUF4255 domain-containing protein [Actinoplanes octamycinicus]|nr:DUF4255 domain-containing protein [Actinoplanes octamycinicus]
MINDLDATLGELLKRDLPDVNVSFDPPDDKFAPAQPAVDLFLYDLRENRELRDNDWLLDRSAPPGVVTARPPLRVACSYLVTAWAGDIRNEHLVLSRVIRVLARYPVLPPEVRQGSLRADPRLPAGTLQPSLLQSAGEFWQAMGGKPKAAFNYTVTIGLDVFERVDAPVVLQKIDRMRLGVEEVP